MENPSQSERSSRHYVLTTSPENYVVSQTLNFSMQGLKNKHGKKAALVKPGDTFIYYLIGLKVFAGIVTVNSNVFTDDSPVWISLTDETDRYCHRFHTEPDVVLKQAPWLEVSSIVSHLQFVRKWPAKHYHLAFQGQIREVPRADYLLIRDELAEMQAIP